MVYTGNGNQNWFLKDIELIVYYVRRPLRGLLKEIPENHLFSSLIEKTCLCKAYGIAFTVQTTNLKRIVNNKPVYIIFRIIFPLFLDTLQKKRDLPDLFGSRRNLAT